MNRSNTKETVFLTGVNGFLGSHIALKLARRGHRVIGLRRGGTQPSLHAETEIEYVTGDIRDRSTYKERLSECDVVIHTAALSSFNEKRKEAYYEANLDGTKELLSASLEAGIKRFIHAGTRGTYSSSPNPVDSDETLPRVDSNLNDDYIRSKLLGEEAVLKIAREEKMDCLILSPTALLGAYDIKPTPIGTIIKSLLANKAKTYMEGGINVIDVEDAATAFVNAIERGRPGETYFLGNTNIRLYDLFKEISNVSGAHLPKIKVPYALAYTGAATIEILSKLKGTPAPVTKRKVFTLFNSLSYCDSTKAIKELGLPETHLKETVVKTVDWFTGKTDRKRATARKTVVLVNPPNERIVLRDMYSSTISKGHYNWPNTDLLVLSGILSETCDVKLIDANTLGLSANETTERIARLKPDGVVFAFGVSVKSEDYAFVALLRQALPETRLIGTGGLLRHNAEEELKNHPEFDACLMNFITDDTYKYLDNDLSSLRNFVYRNKDEIITTPMELPAKNFSYPIPSHDQLPLERYNLSHGSSKPLTSVLTSYGCPAICNFCVAGKVSYTYRDPLNVLEELRHIKSLGVKEVFFRDNTFCAFKKQGLAILKMMKDEGLGLKWVADTRANVITEDSIKIIKESGCHALHIGVESSNEKILKKYHKAITLEQIRRAFKLCHENGIKTVGYFILGLPGETSDDVRRTIDLALELDCDYASFNIPIPIIGTVLREEAIEQDWLQRPEGDYDGYKEPLLKTDSLSPEEISELRSLAYKRFYMRPAYFIKSLSRLKSFYQTKMLVLEFSNIIKNLFLIKS